MVAIATLTRTKRTAGVHQLSIEDQMAGVIMPFDFSVDQRKRERERERERES